MTIARALVGFVLGAVMTFLVPLLGLAMALVLGGVLVWARWRGEDLGVLGPLVGGFLAAAAAYVVLAVVTALA